MLMNAPKTGGASREVLFRLGVVADPQGAAQFKRFGDAIDQQQKRTLDSTKARAAQISSAWKQTADEGVKSFERLQNVGDAAASRVATAWRTASTTVRRAMGEIDTATATGASRAAAAGRMAPGVATTAARSGGNLGEGINNLAGGAAQLIRVAGLSGIAGEQDTQKILDTLIKIEILVAGIHGAVLVSKGAGALGSLGLGGVVAGGPQIAALAAVAGAVVIAMGAKQGMDISSGKPTTIGPNEPFQRGSWFTRFNPLADVLGVPLDRNGDTRDTGSIYGDVESSADRGESQMRARDRAAQIKAEQEQFRREDIANVIKHTDHLKEQLDLQRKARMESLEGAKERLGLIKQELSDAKSILKTRQQEAEEAKKRFQSDLEKFADLDPLERNRLARIRGKVDRGGVLSADESRLAGQFGEFEDAAQRSNIARGLAAGGAAIFTGGARRAAEAQRMAQEIAAQVQRVEVNVRRQQEIILRFERDSDGERRTIDAIRQFEKLLRDSQNEGRAADDEIRQSIARLRLDMSRGTR